MIFLCSLVCVAIFAIGSSSGITVSPIDPMGPAQNPYGVEAEDMLPSELLDEQPPSTPNPLIGSGGPFFGGGRCARRGGICQPAFRFCPGFYTSNFCGGINRRCCVRRRLGRRCFRRGGTCQPRFRRCFGNYRYGLCPGQFNQECCIERFFPGRGPIDYPIG